MHRAQSTNLEIRGLLVSTMLPGLADMHIQHSQRPPSPPLIVGHVPCRRQRGCESEVNALGQKGGLGLKKGRRRCRTHQAVARDRNGCEGHRRVSSQRGAEMCARRVHATVAAALLRLVSG
jgi:hypothetical protein